MPRALDKRSVERAVKVGEVIAIDFGHVRTQEGNSKGGFGERDVMRSHSRGRGRVHKGTD